MYESIMCAPFVWLLVGQKESYACGCLPVYKEEKTGFKTLCRTGNGSTISPGYGLLSSQLSKSRCYETFYFDCRKGNRLLRHFLAR